METAVEVTHYAQWWAVVISACAGIATFLWVLWKLGPRVVHQPVKAVVGAALQTGTVAILCGLIMMGPGIALYSVYPEVGPTVMTRPVGAVIIVFWLVVLAYVMAAGGYRILYRQGSRSAQVPLVSK